jgi:hypothetical protein
VHGLGRRVQAALIRHHEFEYSRLRRVELQTREIAQVARNIYRCVHCAFAFESGTAWMLTMVST